jgi:hypothetical protein
MPAMSKKHFRYRLGKIEIEADENNKHVICWANISTIMYWVIRLALTAAFIYKMLLQ